MKNILIAVLALIGKTRLFLLEVCGVREEDLTEFTGGGRGDDGAREPVTGEAGQPTTVIDVGVGHDHGIDGGGVDRERLPVGQPVALRSLEHPGIDEHRCPTRAHQEAAAGDGAGRSEELQGGHDPDSRIIGDGRHRHVSPHPQLGSGDRRRRRVAQRATGTVDGR